MKNTVYPWLIHVNVWQKPLQFCKVISLKLIKKKKKKTWEKKRKEKYPLHTHFLEIIIVNSLVCILISVCFLLNFNFLLTLILFYLFFNFFY